MASIKWRSIVDEKPPEEAMQILSLMNPTSPPARNPLVDIFQSIPADELNEIVENFPIEVSLPLMHKFKEFIPNGQVRVNKFGPSVPIHNESNLNPGPKRVVLRTPTALNLSKKDRTRGANDQSFLVELVLSSVYIALEIVKASLASLFVVFVPQKCPPDLVNFPGQGNFDHLCSWEENFVNLVYINWIALGFNFGALAVLLLHYFILQKRERFLIEYFDEDSKVPKSHLKFALPAYPTIKIWFHFYNRLMLASSCLVILVNLVNLVLSGIVVLNLYYYDYHTTVTYVTNLLVLATICYRSISVAIQGLQDNSTTAVSGIQLQYLVYNNIDKEHYQDTAPIGPEIPWFFTIFGLDGERNGLDEVARIDMIEEEHEKIDATNEIITIPAPITLQGTSTTTV